MALSALRNVPKIAKCVSTSRTILSNNCVSRSGLRFGEKSFNARTLTRSMFFLSRNRDFPTEGSRLVAEPWSNTCSCGCNMHTKGDKELTAFLEEEIANETRAEANLKVPDLGDFQCKYDGSDVTLTRKFNNETITIKANVNHSVDAEDTMGDPESQKDEEVGEMKAKPDFTVEICKGNNVLSFECSFTDMSDQGGEEAYNDSFQINEIALHDGEYGDTTYSVAGDIMDGYLYDLLMNYLEERGVSSEFADKMVLLFTSYEHKLYVGLLKGMKKFVEK